MKVRIFIGFLLFLVTFPALISAQSNNFFDYNEGLSNSLINKVYQDRKGFIWVATEDGLNRFDGMQFKSFYANDQIPNSLKNNFVATLAEDNAGNLWVGQINGLQVYGPESESFREIELYASDERIHLYISSIICAGNGEIWMTTSGYGLISFEPSTGQLNYNKELNKKLVSLYLRDVFEDSEGILWIGSDESGLNSFNPKTGEIHVFTESSKDNKALPSNNISTICEDNSGHVYVGSLKGGLVRINKKTLVVEIVHSAIKEETVLPVKSLLFDSREHLWVGTDGFGLKLLDVRSDKLQQHAPNTSPFDFSKSKIHSLIEDKSGNIWAGVFQKGLFLFAENPEIFENYGYRSFGENSIGSSCVTSIALIDKQLWVGTDGDGIYRINRETGKVNHLLLKNDKGKKTGNNLLAIYEGTDGFVWLGTYFNGLIRYEEKTGETKYYKNVPEDHQSLINDNIAAITEDKNGLLWLATLGGGVCQFNPKSGVFSEGLNAPVSVNSQIPKYVNSIYIDEKGNFWLGTYVGLFFFDQQAQTLKAFNKTNGALRNNTVFAIQADDDGNIWVGTYGGLVRINKKNFETQAFDTSDGLCNNVVCAINEDGFNMIWVSTHDGLSRFDPRDSSFTNYYAYDGIQANEFYRNATCRSSNGELFFGGINGMTGINRDYQEDVSPVRDVMLTDFMRFNKPVEIGDKSGSRAILKKSIVLADTIQLREQDNVFSIGFTSAELAFQSRISYEYMMEGFDGNWIKTTSQNRRATYTNLPYGTYRFRVRANDKGQYSDPRELTIVIHPRWYKTVMAKVLWSVLLLSIMFAIVLLYKETVRRRHLEKMNEMKMQFFINISHEIKTPLTLILDPIEKLLATKTDERTNRLYKVIYQSASRISRLVNQLMDVRRIDKGVILVKFQKVNISNFIREIAEAYELVAGEKNITFNISTTDELIEVWIDPLNFEKVILNLLSNAFKFTPTGGEVELNISRVLAKNQEGKLADQVLITVSDTGIGIKESDIERIFNRFYQVDSDDPAYRGGTGVGLHLSRALVNLHKGELKANNRIGGSGSCFSIYLPLGNKHLNKEDLVPNSGNTIPVPSVRVNRQFISELEKKPELKGVQPHKRTKILVIDDDEKIRDYLTGELSDAYRVISAADGKHGYELLMEEKPGLVVSDIMMPEMDGITLCKKIKSNVQTSHVPVILLTALSRDENRAEGIETGADMYIVKPFNSEFLKKIIANILANRKKVYEQILSEDGRFDIEHLELKSHDELLMQKVMTIIKDNIASEQLNVEMLADGVGISRVHMHRKLKQLTNQSARDFIRNIRMKQATYLLAGKKLSVSEVAYSLGYSNLSHFSNSFKMYYGVSPTEFVNKQEQST
ncbi:MAG: two-component regulator propeller domain-containing protein [Draconibacterium sp.]